MEPELCQRLRQWVGTLDLSDFEQTTHGRIGPSTIEEVAESLVAAFREPNAYNISSLSQAAKRFAGD